MFPLLIAQVGVEEGDPRKSRPLRVHKQFLYTISQNLILEDLFWDFAEQYGFCQNRIDSPSSFGYLYENSNHKFRKIRTYVFVLAPYRIVARGGQPAIGNDDGTISDSSEYSEALDRFYNNVLQHASECWYHLFFRRCYGERRRLIKDARHRFLRDPDELRVYDMAEPINPNYPGHFLEITEVKSIPYDVNDQTIVKEMTLASERGMATIHPSDRVVGPMDIEAQHGTDSEPQPARGPHARI